MRRNSREIRDPNPTQTRDEKSKNLGVASIKTDLDTAIRHSEEAVRKNGKQDVAHERVNAREFYKTAVQKAENLKLNDNDAGEIGEKVEKAKSKLKKLGESI